MGTGDLITAAQLNGLPVMIANSTLVGDAANITFSSIPGHYAHLLVVCYLRGDTAAAVTDFVFRFNSDGGSNYDHQYVWGIAATPAAGETFATSYIKAGNIPANTAGANLFGSYVIDVPHYTNSANNKAAFSQGAWKIGTATGNLVAANFAGFWRSNAAVTTIGILPAVGNLRAGSRATLYGLAG